MLQQCLEKGSRKPTLVCYGALQLNCVQGESILGDRVAPLMPECPCTEDRPLFCNPAGCRCGLHFIADALEALEMGPEPWSWLQTLCSSHFAHFLPVKFSVLGIVRNSVAAVALCNEPQIHQYMFSSELCFTANEAGGMCLCLKNQRQHWKAGQVPSGREGGKPMSHRNSST